MRWMIRAWTVAFCLWALPSHAAVLDPWAITSLGMLNSSETISINTDTLALTGVAAYSGLLDPIVGAGIFTFHDITGANLSIFGTRTVVARDQIDLRGAIDAGSRPLGVTAAENMTFSEEARSGNIGLSSGRDLIVPGAGIRGRTVSLGACPSNG